MERHAVAREWLYLITCLSIGFIIPVTINFIRGGTQQDIEAYYLALAGMQKGFWRAWLTFLTPYMVFMLVRLFFRIRGMEEKREQ